MVTLMLISSEVFIQPSHSSSSGDPWEKITHHFCLLLSLEEKLKRIFSNNMLHGARVMDEFWEARILTDASVHCASWNLQ